MRAIVLLLAAIGIGCSPEPIEPPIVNVICDPPDDPDGGPPGVLHHYCFSFPTYAGQGAACATDADCPIEDVNPCSVPVCGAAGTCVAAPAKLGAKLCGDPEMSCVAFDCCGVLD